MDSTIPKINICPKYFFGQIAKYKWPLQCHRIGAKMDRFEGTVERHSSLNHCGKCVSKYYKCV